VAIAPTSVIIFMYLLVESKSSVASETESLYRSLLFINAVMIDYEHGFVYRPFRQHMSMPFYKLGPPSWAMKMEHVYNERWRCCCLYPPNRWIVTWRQEASESLFVKKWVKHAIELHPFQLSVSLLQLRDERLCLFNYLTRIGYFIECIVGLVAIWKRRTKKLT
jgi:hypothetical protein